LKFLANTTPGFTGFQNCFGPGGLFPGSRRQEASGPHAVMVRVLNARRFITSPSAAKAAAA